MDANDVYYDDLEQINQEKDMPVGRIDSANISKSGKTLSVQIGGTWYTTKHFELQNMIGQSITFQTSTSEFNGKPIHWLNDYSDGTAGNTPADQVFQAAHAQNQAGYANPPPIGSPPQSASQPPQGPNINREASIIAQALTKSCTAPGDGVQVVWDRYKQFYGLAMGGPERIQAPPSADTNEYDDLSDIPFS